MRLLQYTAIGSPFYQTIWDFDNEGWERLGFYVDENGYPVRDFNGNTITNSIEDDSEPTADEAWELYAGECSPTNEDLPRFRDWCTAKGLPADFADKITVVDE